MNVKAIKLIQVTEINLTSVPKYRWGDSAIGVMLLAAMPKWAKRMPLK